MTPGRTQSQWESGQARMPAEFAMARSPLSGAVRRLNRSICSRVVGCSSSSERLKWVMMLNGCTTFLQRASRSIKAGISSARTPSRCMPVSSLSQATTGAGSSACSSASSCSQVCTAVCRLLAASTGRSALEKKPSSSTMGLTTAQERSISASSMRATA
ncbi:hypothetical protein D3C85_1220630 [compost metagenome]